jgi:hypothetical protein
MPQYSNSPLGLVLGSTVTAGTNRVGSYTSSNVVQSLFSQGKTPTRFGFKPRTSNQYSDLSTLSLITYLENYQSMKLKYSDFAYLKNLGVYPNNRLMIARRFPSPVDDDLTAINTIPSAALISWVPDNEEFIKATDFGEEWENGEASFKSILNDIGKDVLLGDNKGKNLGDFIEGAAGAVPLPGFTEGLQWQIFNSLGATELDASNFPLGNPNIIKESKRRKIYDKDQSSSGLKCKFSVKMTVEYEQKFIDGIDPTIVYYDIIANALTFGTSESQFLFKKDVGSKFQEFINDLASGDGGRMRRALVRFLEAITDAVQKVANEILKWFDSKNAEKTNSSTETNQTDEEKKQKEQARQLNVRNTLSTKLESIKSLVYKLIGGFVNKYKIRIISVVNALTGTPSAPWHITIGDPRFPIFSSGDMLVESVQISMGKLLAFNNLPSSIKLDFTMTSARNLGAQEIYNKFSTGQGRTYQKYQLSFVETDQQDITEKEINQAKSERQMNVLRTKAKVNIGTDNTYKISDANKVGKDFFPESIKNISGVIYVANPDGSVFAKGDIQLREPSGTLISNKIPLSFESDGRVFDYSDPQKPKNIGSFTIGPEGAVTINSTDPRFKSQQELKN